MKPISEREALARLIWSRFRGDSWPNHPSLQSAWLNVADTILAAGFHRTGDGDS